MKSSPPVMSVQMEADIRPRLSRFGLIAMVLSMLMITACGGVSGQTRADSGDMEHRVRDYDNMVKEYERQNGPPNEGFWREVYKDAD